MTAGTLLSSTFGFAEVTNYNNWLRNSNLPQFYEQTAKYTSLELVFLVEGEAAKSNLTAEFLEINTFTFEENAQIAFEGYLTDVKEEKINYTASKLTFTLKGYKTTAEKIITLAASPTTLTAVGNLPTDYVIVKITPIANVSELTVAIGTTEFKLESLVAGTEYVVDGAKSKVYYLANSKEVSKFSDFSGDFPQLQSGANTITYSSGNAVIQIVYKGRWI